MWIWWARPSNPHSPVTQSSLSSSWPEAGTLYSCSWSEYLADLCNATSEVPSPLLKETISVFLCLGDHRLPFCISVATTLIAFLGDPFWTALFPLSSWTWASSLEVGSPSHCLMSSPCSCRNNQSSLHGLFLGLPFPLTGAGEEWSSGLPQKSGGLAHRDVEVPSFFYISKPGGCHLCSWCIHLQVIQYHQDAGI